MIQATAVVLDSNQNTRDEIRTCLCRCGLLPICFDDEWICLENIIHVRPAFVVFRPTSTKMVMRFIYIARLIEETLPIIVISDRQALRGITYRPWLNDLSFLSSPPAEDDLREIIGSFAGPTLKRPLPILIGESTVARQCHNRLQRISRSNEPVLIQGEPGVGKRLISKVIHHCSGPNGALWETVSARDISESWIREFYQRISRSPRSGSPLICCVIKNIEALTDQMQSQLLLIMDTLAAQADNTGFGMPFRLICLAEADLSNLSANGLFRKDLYYRLTVLTLHVPRLRDRREDIPLLADFFTAKYSIENQRCLIRLPEDIRAAFRAYHWPGNVAQLEKIVKKAMAMGTDAWGDVLHQWCRDREERQKCQFTAPVVDISDCLQNLMDGKQPMSLKMARRQCVMQVEKNILRTALVRTHGNCKKAADLLSISYKSMLTKAKEYQLN